MKDSIPQFQSEKHQLERVIFEMFYHRVYNTAYFIIQDRHLAQDVVQETFFKAFQNMHKVEDGHKLGAWLGTIATRTAIDFLRKVKKRNDFVAENVMIDETINHAKESSVEQVIEEQFLKNLIQQNIAGLKAEYKQVIVLKYEYDLHDKEIAQVLEISVSAVKSRLHRARLTLKKLLENNPDVRDVVNHEKIN
ncbi:MAG: RNA polymerase sigma factor [Tepidibacillus sp.]